MLSWLRKRKESKGPGPGTRGSVTVTLLFMQDLAQQVSNHRAGERATAMFTAFKTLSRNISTEVQKIKGLAGPRHSQVDRKKSNSL